MKAELVIKDKEVIAEGQMIEMVVWKVPVPVEPSTHDFKYSLAYIVNGERVVGFDNERGKGDHCHLDGVETEYRFTSLPELVDDFITEVNKRRQI